MAPNTRDTPLRRSTTIIWGSALMLAVVILAVVLAPAFMGERSEVEDDYQVHEQFNASVKAIHEKQADVKASYQYDAETAADNLYKKLKTK